MGNAVPSVTLTLHCLSSVSLGFASLGVLLCLKTSHTLLLVSPFKCSPHAKQVESCTSPRLHPTKLIHISFLFYFESVERSLFPFQDQHGGSPSRSFDSSPGLSAPMSPMNGQAAETVHLPLVTNAIYASNGEFSMLYSCPSIMWR